jgi:hypothetical protein
MIVIPNRGSVVYAVDSIGCFQCASPSIQAAISSVIGMRIKQEAEAAAAAAAAVATRPVHKALEGLSPALIAKVSSSVT